MKQHLSIFFAALAFNMALFGYLQGSRAMGLQQQLSALQEKVSSIDHACDVCKRDVYSFDSESFEELCREHAGAEPIQCGTMDAYDNGTLAPCERRAVHFEPWCAEHWAEMMVPVQVPETNMAEEMAPKCWGYRGI
jgi:hypothetical protein